MLRSWPIVAQGGGRLASGQPRRSRRRERTEVRRPDSGSMPRAWLSRFTARGASLMDYLYRGVDFTDPRGAAAPAPAFGRRGSERSAGSSSPRRSSEFASEPIDELVTRSPGTANPTGRTWADRRSSRSSTPPNSCRRRRPILRRDRRRRDRRRPPIDPPRLRSTPTTSQHARRDPGDLRLLRPELRRRARRTDVRQPARRRRASNSLRPRPGFPRQTSCSSAGPRSSLRSTTRSDAPARARSAGALTVVNTVYDFRAELAHPERAMDARWRGILPAHRPSRDRRRRGGTPVRREHSRRRSTGSSSAASARRS